MIFWPKIIPENISEKKKKMNKTKKDVKNVNEIIKNLLSDPKVKE